jgi:hypothetical protein
LNDTFDCCPGPGRCTKVRRIFATSVLGLPQEADVQALLPKSSDIVAAYIVFNVSFFQLHEKACDDPSKSR